MNNYEEMRIESDVFATARENFDLLMQRLFKSMEKNNSDEGSITLKVDLQMSQDWVPDGKGGSIEINKPVIKHKVSIAVPVKDSMDGKKDAGMNLVWDEDLKRYVLKYINEGGQQSLFDPDYEENLKAGADLDESTMLPGPSNALPENDGVSAETVGVYTKFRGKGLFQAEKRIIKQETTDVGIKAAVSTGVVSIYDRKRDYGIAVPITELAAILNEALRVGMTKKGE